MRAERLCVKRAPFSVRRSSLLAAATLAVRRACGVARRSARMNWPLHNLDLAGSRFSAMDQINTVERRHAHAALAVPDRGHRRRQQSDDAGHRRRHDVRHRSARQRATRSTRPTGICCGRSTSPISSAAAREPVMSSAIAASATPTASSTPPRARSCSRSTRRPASRSDLRQRRPGQRDSRRAQDRYPDVTSAIGWATGSPRRRRSTRA